MRSDSGPRRRPLCGSDGEGDLVGSSRGPRWGDRFHLPANSSTVSEPNRQSRECSTALGRQQRKEQSTRSSKRRGELPGHGGLEAPGCRSGGGSLSRPPRGTADPVCCDFTARRLSQEARAGGWVVASRWTEVAWTQSNGAMSSGIHIDGCGVTATPAADHLRPVGHGWPRWPARRRSDRRRFARRAARDAEQHYWAGGSTPAATTAHGCFADEPPAERIRRFLLRAGPTNLADAAVTGSTPTVAGLPATEQTGITLGHSCGAMVVDLDDGCRYHRREVSDRPSRARPDSNCRRLFREVAVDRVGPVV